MRVEDNEKCDITIEQIKEVGEMIGGNLSVVALDRKLSNHCLIVLKHVELDFGPKPFRVFNVWLDETDFDQVVKEAWKKDVFKCVEVRLSRGRGDVGSLSLSWACSRRIDTSLVDSNLVRCASYWSTHGADDLTDTDRTVYCVFTRTAVTYSHQDPQRYHAEYTETVSHRIQGERTRALAGLKVTEERRPQRGELENQVQRFAGSHLALSNLIHVNKITSSCEICSGPHDTQYCMENSEQAFVEYASSCTDKAGGKWYTFTPEQNNLGDTYNMSWSSHPNLSSINSVTICPKQPNKPQNDESEGEVREERSNPENIDTTPPLPHDPSISFITEKVRKLDSFLESSGLVPQSSDTGIVCTKGDDGDVMFIEIIRKNDDSREEGPEGEGSATIEGLEVEYFDTFPNMSELAYHRKLDPREDTNRGVSNFMGRIKEMHVFVGNFTYVIYFMIVEDISSIIDPSMSQVVLGKPFVEISNMTHDPPEGVVRNEEDKRRGVEYVMSKILGFYKECLELGPEYVTGVADDDKVT
ncbi:hypothetical protein Tco_0964292 [Tanacetum coccineum]